MAKNNVQEMVNFILQEAHEKINELRLKTDHECSVERSALVAKGLATIDEEHNARMKTLEVNKRIRTSQSLTTVRVKKMESRQDLLKGLSASTLDRLSTLTKKAEYSTLLKDLLIQGLIKFKDETIVQVQTRAEDRSTLSKVLPEAVAEFKTLMSKTGVTVNPQVTISDQTIDSKSCRGGIILSALDGRLVINQTVDERLSIAMYDLMPQIRSIGELGFVDK